MSFVENWCGNVSFVGNLCGNGMRVAAGEAFGMPLFRHLGFDVCNPTLFIYRDSVYRVKGKHPGPLSLRITLIMTSGAGHQ